MGQDVLSPGVMRWGLKMTSSLHLVRRLKMSGAIPLLSLYVFTEYAGRTLPSQSLLLLNLKHLFS